MDSMAAVLSTHALFPQENGVPTTNRGHILPYLGHLLLGHLLLGHLLLGQVLASFLLVLALQGLARTSSDAHPLDSMAAVLLTHALFLPGNGVLTINRGRTRLYLEGLLLVQVLIPSLLHQLRDPALRALEAFSGVLPMGSRDVVLWMLATFHPMDGAQITTLGPTLPSLKGRLLQHPLLQWPIALQEKVSSSALLLGSMAVARSMLVKSQVFGAPTTFPGLTLQQIQLLLLLLLLATNHR
jgi:hypothetical protein